MFTKLLNLIYKTYCKRYAIFKIYHGRYQNTNDLLIIGTTNQVDDDIKTKLYTYKLTSIPVYTIKYIYINRQEQKNVKENLQNKTNKVYPYRKQCV